MGAAELRTLDRAIAKAREQGCAHLPTGEELASDVREWLEEVAREVERFGPSAGAPCWNVQLWDGEVPSLCLFFHLTKEEEVVLAFHLIEQRPRAVIDWCEGDCPRGGEVTAALEDFRKRWGAPFDEATVKASAI